MISKYRPLTDLLITQKQWIKPGDAIFNHMMKPTLAMLGQTNVRGPHWVHGEGRHITPVVLLSQMQCPESNCKKSNKPKGRDSLPNN